MADGNSDSDDDRKSQRRQKRKAADDGPSASKKQKQEKTDWLRILEQTTNWRAVPRTVQAVVADRLGHSVTYDPDPDNMEISSTRPWRIEIKPRDEAPRPRTKAEKEQADMDALSASFQQAEAEKRENSYVYQQIFAYY
ncbi:hypothetical protein CONLIGDRAFT_713413 [Coniochaeta ligniaria NRRL 30616]|uniref:Uncharacterized protein n=1 Tax=Coniochaeta ligniaria NRRL 30616 TaxID=1408157 RepID=A0A1J7JNI1_9PEZI|nr:hypothetical protein CONLIGDRAFT_713413 [Coniochaeta ligniaria NRRL 30616]